jgi:RNA polymerase sigma-70 factor (ECF subfamily)
VLVDEDGEDIDALLFQPDGHFREMPQDWGSPEAHCRQHEFFEVMQLCLEQLPPAQGRVFMMREWLGLETDEICKELAISATNLWVLLHRARLRLRECLQVSWFAEHRPS